MREIVEIDERGAIQLPHTLLDVVKPHTRFVLEVQGENLVLSPVMDVPFWQNAMPHERAAAIRRWAALERPAVPPIPEIDLHRDHMYD